MEKWKGSMSQIFDIGPSFYAMECRKLSTEKILKVSPFFKSNKN